MESRLICLLLVALFCSPEAHAEVFLRPKPLSITWDSGPPISLSSSFYFRLPVGSPQELRQAASCYRSLIFREKWAPVEVSLASSTETSGMTNVKMINGMSPELLYLMVSVADLGADLQQGVREAYKLLVPNNRGTKAFLKADTEWGALHGFETFSQLVKWDGPSGKIVLEAGVTLLDEPLYGYWGIMLDVAQNFYPVPDLMRTMRAMAYNKLNVLHLHLTDSQSFPLEGGIRARSCF